MIAARNRSRPGSPCLGLKTKGSREFRPRFLSSFAFWAQFGHKIKWPPYLIDTKAIYLVPGGGVEPPRPCGRRILSPLRLPVPPSRLNVKPLNLGYYSSVLSLGITVRY